MKQAILGLTVAVMLAAMLLGISVLPAADEKSPTPTVKVLSFNIRFDNPGDGEDAWEHRKDFAIDVMRDGDYDFIGLQEVLLRPDPETCQWESIIKNMPEYGGIYRSREINEKRGESTPVLYKKDRWELDPNENGTFWLSATPDEVGSNTWNAACRRVASWGRFTDKKTGKSLYVINTHYDHISDEARQKSSLLIVDFLTKRNHAEEPAILIGDFNCSEKSIPIRFLSGKTVTIDEKEQIPAIKLVDTYRLFKPEGPEEGTFHGFKGVSSSKTKIDYIFATPGVKVFNSEIIRVNRNGHFPSDHFPVDAELQFP